ncbi:uncharacterized protein KY384_002456 [Bacidia gigantensis]|uniref:uncharacterized protein n=1 Tax=Bacidia gigantensis TaxID=2732470 RepID=UPI001D03EE01|nr:uncharacterized protein KY384_002456 [Bacidia gigantensis]KAG8532579.1 hypothetical protein KY384_002456 [Bacidia gigantensis]
MVVSYSPHSDAGGTLHLSPTHIHDVDPTAALRQLRRSLSRSPSKVSAFRLVTSKSTSPAPRSPLSPPREAMQTRAISESLLLPSTTTTPQVQSARKARPPSRKLSPLRHSPRPSSTPRSPRKRTLQESTSQGNATPRSSPDYSDDQENRLAQPSAPSTDHTFDATFKVTAPLGQSSPFPPPRPTARFEKEQNSWGAKSSPLKRSDGIMNFDQGNIGSPAKRRSLHGGVFGPDFDIFDAGSILDGQGDTEISYSSNDPAPPMARQHSSPMPARTSSLRKTTLQQRHEKPTIKSKPCSEYTLDPPSPGRTPNRNKFRMSVDSVFPSIPRDSPFSSQGSLPNASAHPITQPPLRGPEIQRIAQPQRHPLSRTISQSTSTSSMAEDSPTHIPVRQPEQRRAFVDFSKSLPLGAHRPSGDSQSNSQDSLGTTFATPENYKLVKPLPAAFMSTGLISKRHKNTDSPQQPLGASTSTMPDTPCKRHSLADIPSPSAPRNDVFPKVHQVRHSFGTPSTPFNPNTSHTSPANFGKSIGIFGSSMGHGRLQRSDSFLSIDGDDNSQSPSRGVDSQSSNELDVPPTPTRHFGSSHQGFPPSFARSTSRQQGGNSSLGSSFGTDTQRVRQDLNSKFLPPKEPVGSAAGDSDGVMEESPSANLRFRSFSAVPRSFTHSRTLRNAKSPTPLSRASHTAPALLARRSIAKRSPLSPASPPSNRSYRLSPRTPKDNMAPPDPSGLSISQHGEQHVQSLNSVASSHFAFPPATPTASRDFFGSSKASRTSVTPSHVTAPVEVDPVLTSRFDKAEIIGTGEFSQVYRVSRKQDALNVSRYFAAPVNHSSPKPHLPDHVWAVKKTRNPYIGPKDRERKLREVRTLKVLGQSDHTVELVDSWEHNNRLYIQTEFCEEGSLDIFLNREGYKSRLDDFRIWKVLLELSLGLKHIHESGFIHLDLKPANVLITFEGTLKIADFGMAAQWPAQPGIDGEGDREYIGPEILRGEYDKPADIFALGLIMLEIAGNVVLPDNGVSWQRLRSGDMSDVPSLTWSSESSKLRDSSGRPLVQDRSMETFFASDSEDEDVKTAKPMRHPRSKSARPTPPLPQRLSELAEPPRFMVEPGNPEALDNIVRWMISPETEDRPIVSRLLSTGSIQWTDSRRRAGATIFEGNWGPADEVLADDAEMIDV